ncbi:hypothetical protein KDA_19450 [Dictyobacter alpinus]|uniref:Uncharacterized protein n=1 Tax=Dictyobacter alpinus TaxID=2014873 RepID=A0A402B535_9CHLR|nr:hypothetical protein KDA_19450 [Dictyobacter alpinus]
MFSEHFLTPHLKPLERQRRENNAKCTLNFIEIKHYLSSTLYKSRDMNSQNETIQDLSQLKERKMYKVELRKARDKQKRPHSY